MKDLITTGELAKKCGVSVRTVQFYDRKGLLQPSCLSDGGRRMFSEDEVLKLKCICLYRSMEFSLDEIKSIMDSNSNTDFFERVLKEQEEKLDREIQRLAENQKRVKVLIDQLNDTGRIDIKSIEEMDILTEKKKKYRKTEIMTYLFLGCYLLIVITGFPIAVSFGNLSSGVFGIIVILLLLGLVYYHKENNAYLCPNCHEKFTISFLKDLFSPNGAAKGKYLKCPKCNRRGWVKETFPE